MGNRECGFLIAMGILFSFGVVASIWAAVDYYSNAYEVEPTRCQYVKYSAITDSRGTLNGFVTICWEVPEIEPYRVDGPVTLCRRQYVVSGVSCDGVTAQMKEKYPITHPPTMFPCYKAISNYNKMFLTPPDINACKDKLWIGIIFFLSFIIGGLTWFTRDCIQKPKQD